MMLKNSKGLIKYNSTDFFKIKTKRKYLMKNLETQSKGNSNFKDKIIIFCNLKTKLKPN